MESETVYKKTIILSMNDNVASVLQAHVLLLIMLHRFYRPTALDNVASVLQAHCS